jgi:ATP-dependent Clp endopeptidase proteolytic subunit ClpP
MKLLVLALFPFLFLINCASTENQAMVESLLHSNYWQSMETGYHFHEINPNDPVLKRREIILVTGINQISSSIIVEKLFYLNSLDSTKPINLYLKTNGGWIEDAFTIINAMNSITAPVNVWCIAGVQSAGSLILVSATGRRYAYEYSYISIHANRKKAERPYSQDEQWTRIYEDIFKKHSKIPKEWYPLTDNNQYYISPKEALEFGVIDSIVKNNK